MFNRIPMDVIEMGLEIVIIPNDMIPETCLPEGEFLGDMLLPFVIKSVIPLETMKNNRKVILVLFGV